jgi:hypothetical protein
VVLPVARLADHQSRRRGQAMPRRRPLPASHPADACAPGSTSHMPGPGQRLRPFHLLHARNAHTVRRGRPPTGAGRPRSPDPCQPRPERSKWQGVPDPKKLDPVWISSDPAAIIPQYA